MKEAEGLRDREGFGSKESKGYSGSSALQKIRDKGEYCLHLGGFRFVR